MEDASEGMSKWDSTSCIAPSPVVAVHFITTDRGSHPWSCLISFHASLSSQSFQGGGHIITIIITIITIIIISHASEFPGEGGLAGASQEIHPISLALFLDVSLPDVSTETRAFRAWHRRIVDVSMPINLTPHQ